MRSPIQLAETARALSAGASGGCQGRARRRRGQPQLTGSNVQGATWRRRAVPPVGVEEVRLADARAKEAQEILTVTRRAGWKTEGREGRAGRRQRQGRQIRGWLRLVQVLAD